MKIKSIETFSNPFVGFVRVTVIDECVRHEDERLEGQDLLGVVAGRHIHDLNLSEVSNVRTK